ncbi:hypothetical protein DFH05DRAFT_1518990 [Lentinula detonsa]|uniref:Uncharacterized protein n=1 Tax=Lentinula detonsa TaxID=2804962 RepID=A0A9W8PBJ1_9AGAR|nr:hypothetical protein DFH05DRAFT_1518990 [Lentinula detonsa]KAJ3988421.1 hypothetical protein F5890DRAFT_462922 [Lentinula detonsa]
MYLRGLDIRAGLSFRVCAVLFLGLVCAAFTAALPLSDNDMPNPTSSVHLAARKDLKRLPMMLRFVFPKGENSILECEPLDKDKTVKQIQAYLERMQTGFGFVPTISVEDSMDHPSRYIPLQTVNFELKLKGSPTEESNEFWPKWGEWKKGYVEIASPFSPKKALIYQGRSVLIGLKDNTFGITDQPHIELPPATV